MTTFHVFELMFSPFPVTFNVLCMHICPWAQSTKWTEWFTVEYDKTDGKEDTLR